MKSTKEILSFLLFVLLLLTVTACGKINDPLANEPIVENTWVPLLTEDQYDEFGLGTSEDTVGSNTVHCYGDFVYYKGSYTCTDGKGQESSFYTLLRYDLRTGQVSPACRDSACTHQNEGCIFYNATGIVSFLIEDNVLYYITAQIAPNGSISTSARGAIHSYNFSTLEYERLTDWEPCTGGINFRYYNECLYFTQCVYPDDSNHYKKYICSYNLKTSKTENLFVYGDKNDTLLSGCVPWLIDERGRMIFLHLPYDYDPNAFADEISISISYRELKKNAEEVMVVEEYNTVFAIGSYTSLRYANGKMIYQLQNPVAQELHTVVNGEDVTTRYYTYSIVSIDLETGKTDTIIEKTTSGYLLAGKYIYYLPMEPELTVCSDERQSLVNTKGKLIQYNIENKQERVFSIDDSKEVYIGLVGYYYKGRVFGAARNFETEDTIFEIELDVQSGEIRKIENSGIVQPTSS